VKKILALFVAVTIALSLCAVPVFAADPGNLIVNGDFKAGKTGFTTEYNFLDPSDTGDWTLGPPYMYTIGTDPSLYHSAWTSFGDHTTGTGKMMIVNGTDEDPSKLIWGQTVTLPVCDPVQAFTLYAGQTWEIGEVLVKNDVEGKICVQFVLTDEDAIAEGWLITEAHVAVEAKASDIPQKNGNPIPGKFPVNEKLDPGVTETDWYCLEYEWTEGVELVIAAHAVVGQPAVIHVEYSDFCVTSGTDTELASGGYAAIAWGDPNPWDAQMQENLNLLADWIWDAQFVTPEVADNGGMVEFVQNFNIIGTPTSAELKIAADNAFAYSLNDEAETAENLTEAWRDYAALDDFGYPYMVIDPSPSGWSKVYTYDVLGSLVSGDNTLNVTGINADWNTTDPLVNPAAVIYKLCGTSEEYVVDRPYDSETGWGGECDFDGKNWATYITYTPEVCSTSYLLEFWAASSYHTNTAQLQVKINGAVVGSTLELPSTTGAWVNYSTTWDAGSATSALIEIRDLRNVYGGDDFVIDDISFVKQ